MIGSQSGYVLDLTTSPISILPTPQLIVSQPTDVAITPDQAPTAQFTFTVEGQKVNFDASSSSSPVGWVTKYAWKFGDGHKTVTTSPTVSHTYCKKTLHGDKPIRVKLTVTNSAGTSTDVTFTGRTVSNHGGPSAVSVQTLFGRKHKGG